jgi:ligand-binding sensor domain-containing protein
MRLAWLSLPVLWLSLCAARPAGAQSVVPRVVQTFGDASEVTCVASDEHELWIGTMGAGLFRIRGAGAEPERFDSARGLLGNRVRGCALAHEQAWVATDVGLSRIDSLAQRFTRVDEGRFVQLASAAGVVFAARADGVIERFPYDAPRTAVKLPIAAATLAVSDDAARYAAGAIDGRLFMVSGDRAQPIALPEPPGQAREPIERLEFAGRALRVLTASRAYSVDAELRVTTQPLPPAETDPALRGALINARGRYGSAEVIASDAGAFLRASPGAALTRIELGGYPCGARISALAVQGDTLWIGSFDRGLCRLDAKGGFTRFAGTQYLPSDMINALASDGATLYVATDAGLAVVDPSGHFTQLTHTQCIGKLSGPCPWHTAVNGVAVDAGTRDVWIADIGALHRIDPRSGAWQHAGTRAVLGSRAVTRVAAFGGKVAVGTSDRGVLLWDPETKRTRVIDDQHGLADNWVTDLAYDSSGRLWIGTCTHGVSVLDSDGRLRTLTTREGLGDDYVLSVQELDGFIWVGTLRGATVLDGRRVKSSRSFAHARGDATVIDSRYQLSGLEIHDAVRYRGQVWLATDGGLTAIDVKPIPDEAPTL